MPKNLDSPVDWFFLGLLVIVILIGAVTASDAQKALEDPNDKTRVMLEQLPALALLTGVGTFHILILRQSGNIHAEYQASSASAALAQGMSTFRRAKIDAIRIGLNTETELHFNRLFYSHKGRAEGKKVAWVKIKRIA